MSGEFAFVLAAIVFEFVSRWVGERLPAWAKPDWRRVRVGGWLCVLGFGASVVFGFVGVGGVFFALGFALLVYSLLRLNLTRRD